MNKENGRIWEENWKNKSKHNGNWKRAETKERVKEKDEGGKESRIEM
jgi:hypothetical protein